MCNYSLNILEWLKKPEYLALFISVIAICVNVYISWKNRKHNLAKEIYFKYQQITEKIISKLLILEHQKEKFHIRINNTHKANTQEKTIFIDSNDTLNKDLFEENSHEIAALVQIYFPEVGEIWNSCLISMGKMLSMLIVLKTRIDKQEKINRTDELGKFNLEANKLWDKPKEITFDIINKLKEFKLKKME